MKSIELIINGKMLDHHKKCALKAGDLVLLKTKAGSYPIKIFQNNPSKREITVETDPFMYWKHWNYNDIELINTKIKKLLYGKH